MNAALRSQTERRVDNPALGACMRLLLHPAVLAAIGLLAINDHLLRRNWPSALTGKIGDFAWLFFFPALLAAAVTFLAPARLRSRPARVLLACMAITGLVFVSANTMEPVRLWVEETIGALVGVRITITQDPTDVIAVLAFLPLWILASRSADRRELEPRPLAYLVITLGVVLSLANSAAANYGIDCLASEGAVLQASNSGLDEVFISRDGGLTWDRCEECSRTCSAVREISGLVQDPKKSTVQFRYVAGETIERSEDGGVTWLRGYDFEESHEATEALFHLRAPGAPAVSSAAPLSGILEPRSGNAVFAMGYEGVLVHVAEADRWEWVSVGEYGHMASPVPSSPQEAANLLYAEFRISILFGLAAVATVMIAGPDRRIKVIAAVLPWAAFLLAWASSPAANRGGYLFFVVIFIIFAGYLAAVLHVLLFSRAQLRHPQALGLIGILLAAGIVFIVPYVLWAYTLLPKYSQASLLSVAAGVAVMVVGRRLYRRSLRGA